MSLLSVLEDDVDLDNFLENTMLVPITSRHSTPMTEDEIELERRKQIPKSTINQNQWANNVFNDWIKERNAAILNSASSQLMYLSEESEDGHEKLKLICKEKLADCLRFFFHEVRKKWRLLPS